MAFDERFRDRRAHARSSVSGMGRIWYGKGFTLWADCKLIDLSFGGARVGLPALYEIPRRIVFAHVLEDAVFDAVVKWRRGDAVGLSFDSRHELTSTDDPRLGQIVESWLALKAAS